MDVTILSSSWSGTRRKETADCTRDGMMVGSCYDDRREGQSLPLPYREHSRSRVHSLPPGPPTLPTENDGSANRLVRFSAVRPVKAEREAYRSCSSTASWRTSSSGECVSQSKALPLHPSGHELTEVRDSDAVFAIGQGAEKANPEMVCTILSTNRHKGQDPNDSHVDHGLSRASSLNAGMQVGLNYKSVSRQTERRLPVETYLVARNLSRREREVRLSIGC